MGKIVNFPSFQLLLIGPITFLGGGIFEFFIWTANCWLLLSILFTFQKKYTVAFIFGIIALCVSGSFILWHEVLAAENGRMADIYSLEAGYFLWLASIVFLTFSSIYLKIKEKNYA